MVLKERRSSSSHGGDPFDNSFNTKDVEIVLHDRKKQKDRIQSAKSRKMICLDNCKYEVVREAAESEGFKIVDIDEPWNIYFQDRSIGLERTKAGYPFQFFNHIAGMHSICHKHVLARKFERAKRISPDFNFTPPSFVLPGDIEALQHYALSNHSEIYIYKPFKACQGTGIELVRDIGMLNTSFEMVVQRYVKNPCLIAKTKFDMRLYVVVVARPGERLPHVFLYEEGLVRFCTRQYSKKDLDVSRHLTNYAIQKDSGFVQPPRVFSHEEISEMMGTLGESELFERCGHKWSVAMLRAYFTQRKNVDFDAVWREVGRLAVHTVGLVSSEIMHNIHVSRSNAFEILGFDVMFDKNMKPTLIEVNHSPSFTCDSVLDESIKFNLLRNVLRLINVKGSDRRRYFAEERIKADERLLGLQSKDGVTSIVSKHPRRQISKPFAMRIAPKKATVFEKLFPLPTREETDTFMDKMKSVSLNNRNPIVRTPKTPKKTSPKRISRKIHSATDFTPVCVPKKEPEPKRMQRSLSAIDRLNRLKKKTESFSIEPIQTKPRFSAAKVPLNLKTCSVTSLCPFINSDSFTVMQRYSPPKVRRISIGEKVPVRTRIPFKRAKPAPKRKALSVKRATRNPVAVHDLSLPVLAL
ncbi:hypothetical protein PCE1_004871 [Barthelona sp. PCE]